MILVSDSSRSDRILNCMSVIGQSVDFLSRGTQIMLYLYLEKYKLSSVSSKFPQGTCPFGHLTISPSLIGLIAVKKL